MSKNGGSFALSMPRKYGSSHDRGDARGLQGRGEEEEALYDLLSVILIRRGSEHVQEGIYEYLKGIFSGDRQLIGKYSNVTWSSKMAGEVDRMSGLGEAIMQQAMQRGLEQGMQQGREQEILISVKEGDYSPERGAEKLGCSLEDFMKKMELAEIY